MDDEECFTASKKLCFPALDFLRPSNLFREDNIALPTKYTDLHNWFVVLLRMHENAFFICLTILINIFEA